MSTVLLTHTPEARRLYYGAKAPQQLQALAPVHPVELIGKAPLGAVNSEQAKWLAKLG